jgi:alpha-galactosidase
MDGAIPLVLESSGEEGVGMIKALLGLGDLVTNVNLENIGQISNLPLHAVVETNARFSQGSLRPLTAGALPAGLAPLINQHCANQELILEAALSGNIDLAFQAFFNDPADHLPIDTAWELFNKLLELNHEFLPAIEL